MKKFKRLTSYLLVACMMVSLMPVTASAAGNNEVVLNDEFVTEPWDGEAFWGENAHEFGNQAATFATYAEGDEDNAGEITEIYVGGVDALETSEGEGWSFDAKTATLTLNNAEIDGGVEMPGIAVAGDVTIVATEGSKNIVRGIVGINVAGDVTITGGTITVEAAGSEALSMGIVASGKIAIQDCEELDVVSAFVGIYSSSESVEFLNSTVDVAGKNVGVYSNKSVLIQKSKVEAESTVGLDEILSIGTQLPPAGIFTPLLEVEDVSVVTATSQYTGAWCNEVSILGSTVTANGKLAGIFAMAQVSIEGSIVTATANITSEYLNEKLAGIVAIGGPCDVLSITDSEVDVTSTVGGIMVDANTTGEGNLYLANSTIDVDAGYIGIFALTNVEIDNCDIEEDITMSMEEALEYNSQAKLPYLPTAIYSNTNMGNETNIKNSSIVINDALCGVINYDVNITESTFEMNGGICGAYGGFIRFVSCPSVSIQNDLDTFSEFMGYVYQGQASLMVPPVALYGVGLVSIDYCNQVDIAGTMQGMIHMDYDPEQPELYGTVITNSVVDISAGAIAFGGMISRIVNSDVNIETTWTDEECSKYNMINVPVICYDSLEVSNCVIDNNGEVDTTVVNDGFSDLPIYSILDENGALLNNVTLTALNRDELPIVCTEHNVEQWDKTEPDCVTDGKEVGKCTICKKVITNTIPAKGHEYNKDYTVDKEATKDEAGSESRHCKNCDATCDERVIPKLESVYNDVNDVVQNKDASNLTEEDKSVVKEQVAELVKEANTAEEVSKNIDTETVVELEELYIASDDSVEETAVEVDTANVEDSNLSVENVTVEGAALTVENYKNDNAEEDITYQSKITITIPEKTDNEELDDKVKEGKVVVIDINMSVVNAKTGQPVSEEAASVQPVAPIKFTLPVPEGMQGGFKIYHHVDGKDEPEEIPYEIIEKNGEMYVQFVATSFSYYSFEKDGSTTEHEHNWQKVAGEFADPTCEKDGYQMMKCSVEGCTVGKKETLSATGHTYENGVCACGKKEPHEHIWEEVKGESLEPTCTEDGYVVKKCTFNGCEESVIEVVDATGHDHKATVVEPGCTEQGYTKFGCACGDNYIDNYTDATGHKFVDGECENCGEADPDYVTPVTPEDPDDSEDPEVPQDPVKPEKPSFISKIKNFVGNILGKIFGKDDPEEPETPEEPEVPVKPVKPGFTNIICGWFGFISKIFGR